MNLHSRGVWGSSKFPVKSGTSKSNLRFMGHRVRSHQYMYNIQYMCVYIYRYSVCTLE